jgi:hypothetical protein
VGRNDFDADNIYYVGHALEGVGSEIEDFCGSEKATSEASAIWA